MLVVAVDSAGNQHTMFEEIDSFKVSYDDHEVLHIRAKDKEFSIWSENGPFEDDNLGLIDKYVISYDEGKKVYITQAAIDVFEFMEV